MIHCHGSCSTQKNYPHTITFSISRAEQIKGMFHEFDKDGSGSISVEEAKHMLRKLEIPDDEVGCLVTCLESRSLNTTI